MPSSAHLARTLLIVALASLAVAPGATAASSHAVGTATISLGAAGQGLRVAGLRTQVVAPGERHGKRLALPASQITISGKGADVRLRGGLELSVQGRRERLTGLHLRVHGGEAILSSEVPGRTVRLLATTAPNAAKLDRANARVRLTGAGIELTPAGARFLRNRLGLAAIAPEAAGKLTADLRRQADRGTGSGPIVSAPISSEPPLLARPASAVDVHDVSIAWYPRDSWVRYASSGVAAGDGIRGGGGAAALGSTASPCPDRPSGSDAALPYGFSFTPKPSWYDPASGSAGIYGQGAVSFRWAEHTIDLTASDPEIEIAAGAASRAIFRFNGSGGTPYPNQRADLLSLDLAKQPTIAGKTFSFDLMRGTLTGNGVAVFAGFYTPPANDEFGCVSVSFTTP